MAILHPKTGPFDPKTSDHKNLSRKNAKYATQPLPLLVQAPRKNGFGGRAHGQPRPRKQKNSTDQMRRGGRVNDSTGTVEHIID